MGNKLLSVPELEDLYQKVRKIQKEDATLDEATRASAMLDELDIDNLSALAQYVKKTYGSPAIDELLLDYNDLARGIVRATALVPA